MVCIYNTRNIYMQLDFFYKYSDQNCEKIKWLKEESMVVAIFFFRLYRSLLEKELYMYIKI